MRTVIEHPQTANTAFAAVLFGTTYLIARKSKNLSSLLLSSGASLTVSVLVQSRHPATKLLLPIFIGLGIAYGTQKGLFSKRFASLDMTKALASSLIPAYIHLIAFFSFCYSKLHSHLEKGGTLYSASKNKDAEIELRKALALHKAAGITEGEAFGKVCQFLGMLLRIQNKNEDAKLYLEKALEIYGDIPNLKEFREEIEAILAKLK